MTFAQILMIFGCTIMICVDSLQGYSEHSDTINSVIAPTTADIRIRLVKIMIASG